MSDVREHITEVSISAGKKVQLERFEPIDEQATVTAQVPEDLSADEFERFLKDLREVAWEECERGVTQRYEEHVRQEAFGE